MAIINGRHFSKKAKLKVNINPEILGEIEQYCQWAGIEDLGYFVEEAASFVFSKDKDWKNQNKAAKRKYQKKMVQEA